jgi:hypothetical protein
MSIGRVKGRGGRIPPIWGGRRGGECGRSSTTREEEKEEGGDVSRADVRGHDAKRMRRSQWDYYSIGSGSRYFTDQCYVKVRAFALVCDLFCITGRSWQARWRWKCSLRGGINTFPNYRR